MFKKYMLDTIHKVYRGDPWVNMLYDATSNAFVTCDNKIKQLYDDLFIPTMGASACTIIEKDLGYSVSSTTDIETRRQMISDRFKRKQKIGIDTFITLANEYYGDAVLPYYTGEAEIVFNTINFNHFDIDTTDFNKTVDELIPAHMTYRWQINNNAWGDYFNPRLWETMYGYDWETAYGHTWKFALGSLYAKKWRYFKTRTWKETLWKAIEEDNNGN